MRHNFILNVMASAAVLLTAASCSSDDIATSGSDNDGKIVTATFSIAAPGNFNTRATGDGSTATTVACALYDTTDGTPVKAGENDEVTLTDNRGTWSTRVVQGRKYHAVFFAYNKEGGAYDVADLTDIKVNSGLKANAENMDAFTATADIESGNAGNAVSASVTLKRAVAQINFGADDVSAAKARGIEVQQSKITLSGVYTRFDAYNNKVVGETGDMTLDFADIPGGDLTVADKTYSYIGLTYVLVGDEDERNLSDVSYQWKTAESGGTYKTNDPAAKFSNVPVQRNYRTNIIGSLLTNPASFTIEVDGDFNTPDKVVTIASTPTELANAINEGKQNVKLAADIQLDNAIVFSSGEQNINLNGKTLTINSGVGVNTESPVTISNGNVNLGSMDIELYKNSNLTIENAVLTSSGNQVLVCGYWDPEGYNNNTLTIKNTTINGTGTLTIGVLVQNTGNTVIIEDSKINHTWFGITQNGNIPGSTIKLKNTDITGTYSGIYLSNKADGAVNTLDIEGGTITSNDESALEVKKTNITVKGTTLVSKATTQSYSVSGGGSNAVGYGIALVGYVKGTPYEGTTTFEDLHFNLSAGEDAIKIGKYDGTSLVKVQ